MKLINAIAAGIKCLWWPDYPKERILIMAKKNEKTETKESSEQLDLIDVQPENAKAIIAEARVYKKFQAARLNALAKETEHKAKVLNLVKEAKLQPLNGGVIKFKYDGFEISITPRDELVKVKEVAGKDAASDDNG